MAEVRCHRRYPPFLGGKLIRRELGNGYVDSLFENLGERVPAEADLCCYWFEKARQQIEHGKCKRAGLLATQGIRGGANREVLKRIKNTGDIFFAESSRDWILAGANVHVSMVGFDDGTESNRSLNGQAESVIHANLSAESADITAAKPLAANCDIAFMGDTKGGSFDITEPQAIEMLCKPNPHGHPNSNVVLPWVNGLDVTRRTREMFIVDFGVGMSQAASSQYESPFNYVLRVVKPERDKSRSTVGVWWQHERARPDMREILEPLPRFIATVAVSKHRLFVWLEAPTQPDHAVFAFARADDYFFGVLHSRLHEVWALKLGTRLETRPRYTPTTCFETFPFPFADDLQLPVAVAGKKSKPDSGWDEVMEKRFYTLKEEPPAYHAAGSSRREAHSSSPGNGQSLVTSAATKDQHRAAIAAAAEELNELRERWLNPPEWTIESLLKFPGSADGPWSRYIHKPNKEGIGTVRYPRLEPRDADCAAKLKDRTLTKLYNERPAWLDLSHKRLDAAVAAAYGWPADLSDEQILEKLLALNLARAAAESKAAKVKKPKTSREKNADEMI